LFRESRLIFVTTQETSHLRNGSYARTDCGFPKKFAESIHKIDDLGVFSGTVGDNKGGWSCGNTPK
jgi:hypothetical protein